MSSSVGLRRALFAVLSLACAAGFAWGEPSEGMGQNVKDMKLGPFPAMPSCALGSVVNGDPGKGPSILFARTAAGCTIPWHWHTPNEHVILVKGVARLDMQSGGPPITLRAGGYALMPTKHVHRFRCSSACELYVYSDGAFDIHYVDANGKEITADEALKTAAQSK